MQIIVTPGDEKPSALRALAHMLNCLAADRDGSSPSATAAATQPQGATVTELPGNPQAAQDAPGASTPSNDGPNTSVPAGSSTELDWSNLDANGLPWNSLIHSSTKNRNADNTWRYLRGGDADERARIEAEMRAQAPAAAASEDAPPPPPPVVNGDDAPPPPPPVAGNDAPPPPPPVAAATAADSEGHEVTAAMVFKRANALTKEQRDQALELVGLTAMGDFLKKQKEDPSLIQSLWDAMIAITGEE